VVGLLPANKLGRGLPDHLGEVFGQGRPRRRGPPRPDRPRHRRARLPQHPPRPKTRIKTGAATEQAVTIAALERAGATRWIAFQITEKVEVTLRQENRGRPRANARYRNPTRTHHRIAFTIREGHRRPRRRLRRLLAADHQRPRHHRRRAAHGPQVAAQLEKRYAQLKGHPTGRPGIPAQIRRIKGRLCCHFIGSSQMRV